MKYFSSINLDAIDRVVFRLSSLHKLVEPNPTNDSSDYTALDQLFTRRNEICGNASFKVYCVISRSHRRVSSSSSILDTLREILPLSVSLGIVELEYD